MSLYTDAAEEIEANPVARQVVDQRYGILIMQILVISFMGGVYILIRNKYMRDPSEANWQILSFYAMTVLLVFFQNFANDGPIALKILMTRGGG